MTIKVLNSDSVFIFLLAAILVTIPFGYLINSFFCILLVITFLTGYFKFNYNDNKSLFPPIFLYFLLLVSLFWSTNQKFTLNGLIKETPFLFFPLVFIFIPRIKQKALYLIIRIYSFGMVLFALISIIKAFIAFYKTGNRLVFFEHNLVTLDMNSIYVAAFSSICLFYFLQLKTKKAIDYFGLYLLVIFIVLLNSKTIFLIDVILLIWYYTAFSETTLAVKSITIFFISTFFFMSFFMSDKIKDRFLTKYETAFVDNTIYKNQNDTIQNVSISQAWNDNQFSSNAYFPGTAYRVFQIRVFKEIITEQKNSWITGFGFNASEQSIKNKHKQYNLFKEYKYHNFHNQYIQLFAEVGIFGSLLFIVLLYVNVKNALVNNDFLHIVFAVTMIMLFLTESLLCRQRGVVFFITLFCLFNSVELKKVKV